MKYMQEITGDWKCDYKVPGHIYIFDENKCMGYIRKSDGERIMFPKSSKQFSKRGRSFIEVKM